MIFKDLKQGYPLHVLIQDQNGLKYFQGKVLSDPKPYYPSFNNQVGNTFQNSQRMLDVSVEYDGKQTPIQLPENLSTAYFNSNSSSSNYVFSLEINDIIKELDNIRNQKSEELKRVDLNRKIVEDCDSIKETISPEFAAKKESDKRLSTLENKVDGLSDMLQEMYDYFKKSK